MLREATDEDREPVRSWRNHHQVRAMSFGDHVIEADEHADWWQRVSADPDVRCYVYERRGEPCGFVRLDLEDDGEAGWAFFLDVAGLEERGELMPAWIALERETLRLAFDELGLERLHGEVLADNQAVRQLHRRHGFDESEPYEKVVDGRTFTVVEVERRAEREAAS